MCEENIIDKSRLEEVKEETSNSKLAESIESKLDNADKPISK